MSQNLNQVLPGGGFARLREQSEVVSTQCGVTMEEANDVLEHYSGFDDNVERAIDALGPHGFQGVIHQV